MWASSWLGDSACFHIDTSDRERRERATRWNSNVETFHRRVIVSSFVPSFAYSFVVVEASEDEYPRRRC